MADASETTNSPPDRAPTGRPPAPPTPVASSSFRPRRLVFLLAVLLAIVGLLAPVPFYWFWYRPARQAYDEKTDEWKRLVLMEKAEASKAGALQAQRLAMLSLRDDAAVKALDPQIEEARKVVDEKRRKADHFWRAIDLNEAARFSTAKNVTSWTM